MKPWRIVCCICAVALVLLGLRLLVAAGGGSSFGEIAALALFGMSCFIAASVFMSPALVSVVSHPLTKFFGDMFYPTETLTRPPEPLLRALRMRLRDRQWEPVTQQIDALTRAYGPSADLLHLRAHLVAGQTGEFKTVTAGAVSVLPSRDFDRYTALLRRDPPPATVQIGIDA